MPSDAVISLHFVSFYSRVPPRCSLWDDENQRHTNPSYKSLSGVEGSGSKAAAEFLATAEDDGTDSGRHTNDKTLI